MATHTTIGKFMPRVPWLISPLVASSLLLGCMTTPGTPPEKVALRIDSRVISHWESELTTLRTDLAAARIDSAKKEAELQELRSRVTELRQEIGSSQQALNEARRSVDGQQAELSTVRGERDQLMESKKTMTLHNERVLADLTTTVQTLTHELAQVKHDLTEIPKTLARQNRAQDYPLPPVPSSIPESSRQPMVEPAVHILGGDSSERDRRQITVQAGDTLGELARYYGTTVGLLRRMNKLTRDSLKTGQQIFVPVPAHSTR